MKLRHLLPTLNGIKPLSLALAIAALTGCGGTGQDVGSINQSTPKQTFSGRAIDGYLARSTVFLDSNNNGTRDAWEAWAFTDNDGYYSYNPKTQIDYCAASASPLEAQYCLVSSANYDNVVVRIDGGYDVLTGEPYLGQLSRRLPNLSETPSNTENQIISPITTLLTNISEQQSQTSILASLNLTNSSVNVDYLNVGNAGIADMNIFNAAMRVEKVVNVLSDRLNDTYTEIGEDFGTPNNSNSYVYNALAQQLLQNSDRNFNQVVENSDSITSIISQSETALRNIYTQREFELPTTISTAQIARSNQLATSVVQVVNRVIDPTEVVSIDLDRLRGASRTVETLVIKAVSEVGEDTSIANLVEFVTNQNNTTLVDTLIQSLSEDTSDLSTLVQNNFSAEDFDSEEEIRQASQLSELAERFTQIAGKQLRVSDLDLGSAPNALKDMELEVYFQGIESDLEGGFTACAKFIEDAHSDGTLGEGNTRGELISGYWSLLNAGDGGSYSLLLTIQFLGSNYSAIMKAIGPTEIGATTYKQFRFDNDGDYRIWHSEQGLTITASVPTTSEQCQQRLPSRVGL